MDFLVGDFVRRSRLQHRRHGEKPSSESKSMFKVLSKSVLIMLSNLLNSSSGGELIRWEKLRKFSTALGETCGLHLRQHCLGCAQN